MTTSRSDLPSPKPSHALLAAAFAVVLTPLVASATGGLDEVGYKIKPADGNLWAQRFRGGRLIGGGGCARRCIAFTFDDGPNWETTPALLDTLALRDLRATFFVTGHRIDGDGEVARRNREVLATEWRLGHLVGNHTYHHDLLDTMSEATLRFEIDRTEALIRGVIGERTWLFRAPYGALHHPRAVRAVFSRDYTPVFWAMDSQDWRVNTPEAVLANVRAELDRAPRRRRAADARHAAVERGGLPADPRRGGGAQRGLRRAGRGAVRGGGPGEVLRAPPRRAREASALRGAEAGVQRAVGEPPKYQTAESEPLMISSRP